MALEEQPEGAPPEPPASALLALTDCITRACSPFLHGSGTSHLCSSSLSHMRKGMKIAAHAQCWYQQSWASGAHIPDTRGLALQ